MKRLLPALFVGHGNPMHAIGANDWTRAWRALGRAIPKLRAVLCVSAHWYVRGSAVTAMEPSLRSVISQFALKARDKSQNTNTTFCCTTF